MSETKAAMEMEERRQRSTKELLWEAIFEAIGAASVCWENPGGAGIFKSEEATDVANELIQRLYQLGILTDSERTAPAGYERVTKK